jgi:transposase
VGQPVEITRLDYSASELRAIAVKIKDASVVRRLLAVALVWEGQSREAAATVNGMTRQTLRDWVHRYNADGVAGLRSGFGGGAAPLLSASQMAELANIVIAGPDPERHRVVRWRLADLCEEIGRRWSVRVCRQTVGRWMRQLRMTRLQPRPYHPKKDAAAQEAFKKRARFGRPPVAVETDCAIVDPRGAAVKFLVDLTPQKNVVHGLLRTCEW